MTSDGEGEPHKHEHRLAKDKMKPRRRTVQYHSDAHDGREGSLKKKAIAATFVDENRDFVVVLSSGANKTFHLDKDIPHIYFVDFEEATATAHLENTPPGTSSEHNTFTVFGTTNTMIHMQENCYDTFRLLTTMANNSLGKTEPSVCWYKWL
jgi:hypothetical protein